MKTQLCFLPSVLVLTILFTGPVVLAQSSSFTYQGRLTDGGTAANGNYDFQFALFDSPSGGNLVGAPQTINPVAVNEGVFVVTLDFGAAVYPGADRFLEIDIRPSGNTGGYQQLLPRQKLTGAPYAIQVLNATTAITANGLTTGAFVTASNSIVLGRNTGPTLDNVGIGLANPTFKLHVIDAGNTGLRVQTNTAGGTVASFGGNGDFQVDAVNVPGGRLIVQQAGNVGIGTATPQANLDVNGIIRVASFGSAGSTQLCLNASSQISSCGSSLRYKTNIAAFVTGMQLIKQLQPITFDWKQSGIHDVGFGAEDVAQLNRLFVTYNQAGQIEGVKYDRFATLFVNAFKEQQEQIETQQQFLNSQQSEMEQQQAALQTQHEESAVSAEKLKAQLESQRLQLARHQRMIHELRTLVCQTNRQASACRKN